MGGIKLRKYYAGKIPRSENGSDRVIMIRGEEMHDILVEEFRSQIGQDDVHTMERLEELQDSFGLIILRTEKSAETAWIFNGLHEQNYLRSKGKAAYSL